MVVYLHEHLYQWVLGQAEFNSPPFFYPQRHVLGYTDAFILNLLPYVALRQIGIDPFLTVHLLAVCLSLLGFASATLILAQHLQVRLPIALTAAWLITFPNNMAIKILYGHTVFMAMYYVPFIALIAIHSIKKFPRIAPSSVSCIVAAAFLYALLFATSFNTAWLFGLTCLIAVMTIATMLWREARELFAKNTRSAAILGAAAAVSFFVGLIPFALVYGPVLPSLPTRTFEEYRVFAPLPYDIVNVSEQNAIWGGLMKALRIGRNVNAEVALAVTPGMVLIFLVLAFRAIWQDKATKSFPIVLAIACVVVWAVSWLLTVRIGTVSGFYLLRHAIPGATGVRAGGRIQLFVNLWVVCGLAVLVNDWFSRANTAAWTRLSVVAAVLLYCVAEQIHVTGNRGLARADELARLDKVPMPPRECQAFLIDSPDEQDFMANIYAQLDAMWISMKTGLPTLNGLSGNFPPHWLILMPQVPQASGRMIAAHDWIKRNNMTERVCLYDRTKRQWSPFSPT